MKNLIVNVMALLVAVVLMSSCGKAVFTYAVVSEKDMTVTITDGSKCEGSVSIPSEATIGGKSYRVVGVSSGAFKGDSLITSVEIPASIESVGNGAFAYCSALEKITVAEDNKFYHSPDDCNAIVSKKDQTLVAGCQNTQIPATVKQIAPLAFAGCSNLANLEIPAVEVIGDGAFLDCKSLKSLKIPASVKKIGEGILVGCESMEAISVDAANANYDSRESCNAILETKTNTLVAACKTTVVPNATEVIAAEVFRNCSGIKEIVLPSSVKEIKALAFADCKSLSKISIPAATTKIALDFIKGCDNMSVIEIDGANTVYGSPQNCNAVVEKASEVLLVGCKNSTIPDGVYKIEDEAFLNCKGLTSLTMPNSVQFVGRSAFDGCENLKSVTFSGSLLTIEVRAFANTALTKVEFPNSLLKTEMSAFEDCKQLASIVISPSMKGIGEKCFMGCSKLTSIEIPATLNSIGDKAFAECENLTSARVPKAAKIGMNTFSNSPAHVEKF